MILYSDARLTSPYVLSVFVALVQKNVDFELRLIDLQQGAHYREPFASLSLTRRVPTLVDGDFVLTESSAIIEYLDEVCAGPGLLPQESRQRAQARQIQAWLRSDLAPLRHERSTEVVFYQAPVAPLSVEAQSAADKLFSVAQRLLQASASSYVFDEWCLADVELALMLQRLVRGGDRVPADLRQYAVQQWAHPAIELWEQRVREARGA